MKLYLGKNKRSADTHLCPFVHGEFGDIDIIKENLSFIRLYKADHLVKGSSLAGTVRPKQTDDLSLLHIK